MKLKLERRFFFDTATIGRLFADGIFICYIVEDVVRDKNKDGDLQDEGEAKVMHKTAIPYGTYEIAVTMSQRFKRELPILLNVPEFEGIRIHTGNTEADTSGCLLPATYCDGKTGVESTAAFTRLFAIIRTAIAAGEEVTIEIV